MEFAYRNVNYALHDLPRAVRDVGISEKTRNGPVISAVEPLTLTTLNPMERVLLCPKRRANPFLFLLDGISILSSVDFVRPFSDIVPRFMEYSDDGIKLRGHYGRRIHWQIPTALDILRLDPKSRRVNLSMWDAKMDLAADSKDIPCNVHVNMRIVKNRLDATVFNRSNDLMWGMLGANIVQFSFLQEYMARRLGVEVGVLRQISTNAHIYTEFGPGRGDLQFSAPPSSYPPVIPLEDDFLTSALNLMFLSLSEGVVPDSSHNSYVNNVVLPMLRVWHRKDIGQLQDYPDCDWFYAARMFMGVR